MPLRWSDFQVTIDSDGKPLPRDSRALRADDGATVSPSKKRKSEASSDGVAERGGKAAEASYQKSARKANWDAVLTRTHAVGQCADCEEASNRRVGDRCPVHASTQEGEGSMWWHQPEADAGARVKLTEAQRTEHECLQEANSGWRREWRRIRAEQLTLQDEGHGAEEARLRPGGPESVEWVAGTFSHQIALLVRTCGFADEQAIGYTLLCCGGLGALARAARLATGQGKGEYKESRKLLGDVLCERACATPPPRAAPPLYANLTGPLGLTLNDATWARLTPSAPLGLSFTTNALVATNDEPLAFVNNREKHDCLARSGVREWQGADSDIVCFISEAAAHADADGDASQHVVRSMVHVGGSGYHLPPGATVTLVGIAERFRAHNRPVRRRCYTVHVAFDVSDPAIQHGDAAAATCLPPSAETDAATAAGVAAAAAATAAATAAAPAPAVPEQTGGEGG
jgi:hypothetical protein